MAERGRPLPESGKYLGRRHLAVRGRRLPPKGGAVIPGARSHLLDQHLLKCRSRLRVRHGGRGECRRRTLRTMGACGRILAG